ncbi:hypothetical protein BJ741DRAFT_591156 [Chytriomyces cf. hyalinus JEL632]|nr:hypothetical protein BJ741DRAFT_591156 [Chytriomyces cf. hyalinus JEL632]
MEMRLEAAEAVHLDASVAICLQECTQCLVQSVFKWGGFGGWDTHSQYQLRMSLSTVTHQIHYSIQIHTFQISMHMQPRPRSMSLPPIHMTTYLSLSPIPSSLPLSASNTHVNLDTESDFCKDLFCCGIHLKDLHQLQLHGEVFHAIGTTSSSALASLLDLRRRSGESKTKPISARRKSLAMESMLGHKSDTDASAPCLVESKSATSRDSIDESEDLKSSQDSSDDDLKIGFDDTDDELGSAKDTSATAILSSSSRISNSLVLDPDGVGAEKPSSMDDSDDDMYEDPLCNEDMDILKEDESAQHGVFGADQKDVFKNAIKPLAGYSSFYASLNSVISSTASSLVDNLINSSSFPIPDFENPDPSLLAAIQYVESISDMNENLAVGALLSPAFQYPSVQDMCPLSPSFELPPTMEPGILPPVASSEDRILQPVFTLPPNECDIATITIDDDMFSTDGTVIQPFSSASTINSDDEGGACHSSQHLSIPKQLSELGVSRSPLLVAQNPVISLKDIYNDLNQGPASESDPLQIGAFTYSCNEDESSGLLDDVSSESSASDCEYENCEDASIVMSSVTASRASNRYNLKNPVDVNAPRSLRNTPQFNYFSAPATTPTPVVPGERRKRGRPKLNRHLLPPTHPRYLPPPPPIPTGPPLRIRLRLSSGTPGAIPQLAGTSAAPKPVSSSGSTTSSDHPLSPPQSVSSNTAEDLNVIPIDESLLETLGPAASAAMRRRLREGNLTISAQELQSVTEAAAAAVSTAPNFTRSGNPVELGPDGRPVKRGRGRPRKKAVPPGEFETLTYSLPPHQRMALAKQLQERQRMRDGQKPSPSRIVGAAGSSTFHVESPMMSDTLKSALNLGSEATEMTGVELASDPIYQTVTQDQSKLGEKRRTIADSGLPVTANNIDVVIDLPVGPSHARPSRPQDVEMIDAPPALTDVGSDPSAAEIIEPEIVGTAIPQKLTELIDLTTPLPTPIHAAEKPVALATAQSVLANVVVDISTDMTQSVPVTSLAAEGLIQKVRRPKSHKKKKRRLAHAAALSADGLESVGGVPVVSMETGPSAVPVVMAAGLAGPTLPAIPVTTPVFDVPMIIVSGGPTEVVKVPGVASPTAPRATTSTLPVMSTSAVPSIVVAAVSDVGPSASSGVEALPQKGSTHVIDVMETTSIATATPVKASVEAAAVAKANADAIIATLPAKRRRATLPAPVVTPEVVSRSSGRPSRKKAFPPLPPDIMSDPMDAATDDVDHNGDAKTTPKNKSVKSSEDAAPQLPDLKVNDDWTLDTPSMFSVAPENLAVHRQLHEKLFAHHTKILEESRKRKADALASANALLASESKKFSSQTYSNNMMATILAIATANARKRVLNTTSTPSSTLLAAAATATTATLSSSATCSSEPNPQDSVSPAQQQQQQQQQTSSSLASSNFVAYEDLPGLLYPTRAIPLTGRRLKLGLLSIKPTGTDEKRFICPVCGKDYKNANGVKYHLGRFHNDGRGVPLLVIGSMESNIVSNSADEPVVMEEENEDDASNAAAVVAAASTVEAGASTVDAEKGTDESAPDRPFVCIMGTCDKSFKSLVGLKAHVKQAHSQMFNEEEHKRLIELHGLPEEFATFAPPPNPSPLVHQTALKPTVSTISTPVVQVQASPMKYKGLKMRESFGRRSRRTIPIVDDVEVDIDISDKEEMRASTVNSKSKRPQPRDRDSEDEDGNSEEDEDDEEEVDEIEDIAIEDDDEEEADEEELIDAARRKRQKTDAVSTQSHAAERRRSARVR